MACRQLRRWKSRLSPATSLPHHRHYTTSSSMAVPPGLSILCEESCGTTTTDITKSAATAEREGVVLQVGDWRRFVLELAPLRADVQGGRLGDIALGFCWHRDGKPGERGFRRRNGGITVEMGVHESDQIRWVTSQETGPVEVMVSSFPSADAVEDDVGERIHMGLRRRSQVSRAAGRVDRAAVRGLVLLVAGARGDAHRFRPEVRACLEFGLGPPRLWASPLHSTAVWRHVDLGASRRLETRARMRRVRCPEHGRSVERVPFGPWGAHVPHRRLEGPRRLDHEGDGPRHFSPGGSRSRPSGS